MSILNKKAYHEYEVIETYIAGLIVMLTIIMKYG